MSPLEQTDLLNTGEMMKQMAVWMEGAKDRYFARVGWADQAHVPSINNYPSIYKNHATVAQSSISWQCAASIAANAVSTLGLASCGVTLGFGCGAAVVGKIFSYAGIFGSC